MTAIGMKLLWSKVIFAIPSEFSKNLVQNKSTFLREKAREKQRVNSLLMEVGLILFLV